MNVSTPPEPAAIKRSLQTLQTDELRVVRSGNVTQFSLRRGIATATVNYDAGKKSPDRLLLYSVGFNMPSAAMLAANRAFLDDIYAALRRDIGGLPPASEIVERPVNLSQR